MALISASLLTADLAALGQEARWALDAGADWLHFDVMDGHFVPNLTFGAPVLTCLHRLLPEAHYDVHLMVSDPEAYVEPMARAGASSLTFHLEALPDAAAVQRLLQQIRAAGCRAGISIRPGTPVKALLPWLPQLDLVLVMSVVPGFGGQQFMPLALPKLAELKAACTALGPGGPRLEVDGGINASTGPQCLQAGADVLVLGSALFKAADPAALAAALKAAG